MLARDVRVGGLSEQAARDADSQFETVMALSFVVLLPDRNDFDLCKRYLQRFETGLRVGDALRLAIASNRNARTFYTLDKKLLRAGKFLGLSIATGIH
jgi:predicted nucleic acid-binding protein